MSSERQSSHAADVTAREAFDLLQQDPKAQLVDVRTQAEWSFVGVPDLSSVGKEVVLVEWQRYPAMDNTPDFVAYVERELAGRGVSPGDPVLFLCRSGARSLSATRAMSEAGWKGSRNVAGGFEGPMDPERHRGRLDGWKAAGLPWVQS